MPKVTLYEDNAGGLYLHAETMDTYFGDAEQPHGTTFADDAMTLQEPIMVSDYMASGNWNLPEYPIEELNESLEHPEFHAVAEYIYGTVKILHPPGRSAERYLGMDAPGAE